MLRTDVLVIGGGIAGATAALTAAAQGASVLVLSKTPLKDTNTAWAQGGIAVALHADDSVDLHLADTLTVGAGLTNRDVAQAVLSKGKDALQRLQQVGAAFDLAGDGALELGREGGHTTGRVVHARGDSTGVEIQEALIRALAADERISVREGVFVRDLLTDDDGRCVGAVARVQETELAVEARAVILASGGLGQVFRETTNPIGASGDGVALAFRCGAALADLEFVQFHPTTLYIAGAARFLISEVVRGAGARLLDRHGHSFMQGQHPLADLAPRDVVSRAILDRMVETEDTHVYLDLSTVTGDPRTMFPSIARICSAFDIDLTVDPIPVRPGAHYSIGGAVTDLHGRTSVPGLFAAGEVAATHLHGANRLASNSLLEGAVLGHTAGEAAATEALAQDRVRLPQRVEQPPPPQNAPRILLDDLLYSLKSLMWRNVGLQRDATGLDDAMHRIGYWQRYLEKAQLAAHDTRAAEMANMLTASAVIAAAAAARTESRGTHYRTDFTERDDDTWCRHVVVQRSDDGAIATKTGPLLPPSDVALSPE